MYFLRERKFRHAVWTRAVKFEFGKIFRLFDDLFILGRHNSVLEDEPRSCLQILSQYAQDFDYAKTSTGRVVTARARWQLRHLSSSVVHQHQKSSVL